MAVLHLWNILFNLLTSTVGTDNPIVSNDIDIVYTIAGDQCIIGTWPLNGSNLAINVTKGNGGRLNAFIGGSIGKHTTVQFGRLILKYNHSIMEASLMFDKVSSEDEGLYEILETFYMPKSAPYDTVPEAYERKDGRWSLELNILERGEVQQGEVGESITMEFETLPEISTLYIFDTVGSVLHEQSCSISTQSHLYGRLRCVSDKFHKKYRITIDNVTQRDAGLYKVSTERDKRWRRFLNITEKPACAVVGENMTFGWFYNQQGIKRTLLVIHPKQEVIMQLAPTHVPEIKRKFQHRFSYKGNVSGSFMLLTLLNVSKSDAGLYSIETLHGNIIPGWKQLNVGGVCTTTSRTSTNLPPSEPLNSYSARSPLYESTTVSFQPTYVRLSVAVVLGVVSVILLMSICFIYLQRRNSYRLDAVQRSFLEKCETFSFDVPSTIMTPLPVRPWEEVRTDRSVAESGGTCNGILGLHYAAVKDLTPVQTDCSSTYSLAELDDKLNLDYAVNCNKLSDKSNEMASAAFDYDVEDGILEESPSVSTSQTTIGDGENENNVDVSKQVVHKVQASYAKVKKRPICLSSNSEKRYCKNELVLETEEDVGYETIETAMNQISTKDAKVFEDEDGAAIAVKNREPTEEMIPPGLACKDYADID